MTREEQILSLGLLVRGIANKFSARLPGARFLYEDLVAAGWCGAIHAVDRFDPHRGGRLATFAEWHIRGAIQDYLRELDPMSRDHRRQFRAEVKRAELAGEEPPTAPRVVAIDQYVMFVPDKSGDQAPAVEARVDVETLLNRAQLKPREIALVCSHCLGTTTLKEFAKSIGVGESRCSQILTRVMQKLRKAA